MRRPAHIALILEAPNLLDLLVYAAVRDQAECTGVGLHRLHIALRHRLLLLSCRTFTATVLRAPRPDQCTRSRCVHCHKHTSFSNASTRATLMKMVAGARMPQSVCTKAVCGNSECSRSRLKSTHALNGMTQISWNAKGRIDVGVVVFPLAPKLQSAVHWSAVLARIICNV